MKNKKKLTIEEIKDIVLKSTKDVISSKQDITLNSVITGPGSAAESIEIVQIISAIEDQLEINGIEGYDLFDEIFKTEEHTLESLSQLIKDGI
tara:strand:+ start:321 stop:599 length:279 start_codon:yes stop_codon:yes gene_type:complete